MPTAWLVMACWIVAWALLLVPSAVLAQEEESAAASGQSPAVAQDEAPEAGDNRTAHDDGRRTLGKLPIDGPQLSVMPIVGPSGQRGLAVRIVY